MTIYGSPRSRPLSGQEVAQHAYNAGFRGEDLVIAVAIAKGESNWDAHAVGDINLTEPDEQSTGLWQVHYRPSRDKGKTSPRWPEKHFDPATNARYAYELRNTANGFRHWSVYKDGKHKQHMDVSRRAAQNIDQSVPASTTAASDTPTGTDPALAQAGQPYGDAPIVEDLNSLIAPTVPNMGTVITYVPGGKKDILSQRFTGGSVDLTTDEASQVTLTFMDHDFRLLKHNPGVELGAKWKLFKSNLYFSVMSIETYEGRGGPALRLNLQPFGIAYLKKAPTRGIKAVSATGFIRQLATATQMTFIGEDTASRSEIVPLTVETPAFAGSSRMVKRGENMWEMARRLAVEEGYYLFESANTLFFGSAAFLRTSIGSGKVRTAYISYTHDAPPHAKFGKPLQALETPRCIGSTHVGEASSSSKDSDRFWQPSIDLKVDKEQGANIRAGMGLFFTGVPRFDGGGRIITRISYSLDDKSTPMTVNSTGLVDLVPTQPGGASELTATSGILASGEIDTSIRAAPAGTRLNTAQRNQLFGPHGINGVREPNLVRVMTPWGIATTCHAMVAERFVVACQDAHDNSSWRPVQIQGYNGRKIGGSDEWSLHAWSLAWDIFDTMSPSDVWGPKHAPDKTFRDIFEQHGFYAGARFSRRADYPHIEWPYSPPTIGSPGSTVPRNVT